MNKTWRTTDIVDLLAFTRLDEENAVREEDLARRDRNICLRLTGGRKDQAGQAPLPPPETLVRRWLDIRRQEVGEEERKTLPGRLWREVILICRCLFLGGGLLTGLLAVGAFLAYSGKAPLNVSAYFALFIAFQFLLFCLQALLLLARRPRLPMLESAAGSSALCLFLGPLLLKAIHRLWKRLRGQGTAAARLDRDARIGALRQHREETRLILWPAFICLQAGGIGFNLGVLAATLAKVIFSDVAFGWQSSLQLAPELVARLVRWIALPWSWLPHTAPSQEQIEGSRFLFKEGIASLNSEHLLSWWPFLCMAVCVYGLLPRLLLLAFGIWGERRTAEQLSRNLPGIRRIARRMQSPRLDTRAMTDGAAPAAPPSPPPPGSSEKGASKAAPFPEQTAPIPRTDLGGASPLLLIPEELAADCPPEALARLLPAHLAGEAPLLSHAYTLAGGLDPLRRFFEEKASPQEVLLLQEAWQPPLKETEIFLRGLRGLLDLRAGITIVLIGRPGPATILTPADPEQARIWQQKVQALGDPFLSVLPLIPA